MRVINPFCGHGKKLTAKIKTLRRVSTSFVIATRMKEQGSDWPVAKVFAE